MTFPTEMLVDYVRVYQRKDSVNIGCDPKDYPTMDYISRHAEAFNGSFSPRRDTTLHVDRLPLLKIPSCNIGLPWQAAQTSRSLGTSWCAIRTLRPLNSTDKMIVQWRLLVNRTRAVRLLPHLYSTRLTCTPPHMIGLSLIDCFREQMTRLYRSRLATTYLRAPRIAPQSLHIVYHELCIPPRSTPLLTRPSVCGPFPTYVCLCAFPAFFTIICGSDTIDRILYNP